jgi:hypothetical protein
MQILWSKLWKYTIQLQELERQIYLLDRHPGDHHAVGNDDIDREIEGDLRQGTAITEIHAHRNTSVPEGLAHGKGKSDGQDLVPENADVLQIGSDEEDLFLGSAGEAHPGKGAILEIGIVDHHLANLQ